MCVCACVCAHALNKVYAALPPYKRCCKPVKLFFYKGKLNLPTLLIVFIHNWKWKNMSILPIFICRTEGCIDCIYSWNIISLCRFEVIKKKSIKCQTLNLNSCELAHWIILPIYCCNEYTDFQMVALLQYINQSRCQRDDKMMKTGHLNRVLQSKRINHRPTHRWEIAFCMVARGQ